MKSILAKLHAVMSAVDYIQKDKENTFHRYKYASEQAIKEALHTELVKNKVIFGVSVTGSNKTPITTAKGNQSFVTDVKLTYAFWDVDSGESVTGEFIGTGEDPSDKGTYKAITGAIKYILTSTFLIPTGDDAEADTEEKAPPKQPSTTKPAGTPVKAVQQATQPAGELGNCKDCGAPNKKSQAGKLYCSKICWEKPKAEVPTIQVDDGYVPAANAPREEELPPIEFDEPLPF